MRKWNLWTLIYFWCKLFFTNSNKNRNRRWALLIYWYFYNTKTFNPLIARCLFSPDRSNIGMERNIQNLVERLTLSKVQIWKRVFESEEKLGWDARNQWWSVSPVTCSPSVTSLAARQIGALGQLQFVQNFNFRRLFVCKCVQIQVFCFCYSNLSLDVMCPPFLLFIELE